MMEERFVRGYIPLVIQHFFFYRDCYREEDVWKNGRSYNSQSYAIILFSNRIESKPGKFLRLFIVLSETKNASKNNYATLRKNYPNNKLP